MLFAINSNSYRRDFASGCMELFDWMTLCARELRVHGIEISAAHIQSADEDYIKAVRRIAVDLQLTIAAISIESDFSHETEPELEKELEEIERALETAHALGAPILRIRAGNPGSSRENAWPEMVRCLEIVCLLAERDGIVIALENETGVGFIRSSEDVHRIMSELDCEWLRLSLNTANFADDWESLEKSLIYNVLISASTGNIERDGHDPFFDYPALFALLRESNYRGFVSLDYSGDEAPKTAVPRLLESLRATASQGTKESPTA